MTNLAYLVKRNKTTLLKTASYYVIHVVVAAIVAYAVTRSLVAAITLSLLEPTTQAVAYFLHDDPASFPRTPSHAASRLLSFVTGAMNPMAVCMRNRL